jgi:hypothetical protein
MRRNVIYPIVNAMAWPAKHRLTSQLPCMIRVRTYTADVRVRPKHATCQAAGQK